MNRPASRSQGSRSHPCAHFVRFTEEENKALHKLVRARHLTVQAFLHAAAMRALNRANAGEETTGEIERRVRTEERTREYQPHGLGIRDQLQEHEVERPERDDVPQKTTEHHHHYTPPAVSSAQSADIFTLARSIVGQPRSARKEALAAAVRSLAHGRAQDEAIHLAEQLDAEIKRIDGAPTTVLEKVRARMKR